MSGASHVGSRRRRGRTGRGFSHPPSAERCQRPKQEPQEQRQGENVKYRAEPEALKQGSAGILPPATYANQPGANKPNREMTPIQRTKLASARAERQQPEGSGQ